LLMAFPNGDFRHPQNRPDLAKGDNKSVEVHVIRGKRQLSPKRIYGRYCGTTHLMHNLRSPRCTACTKGRAKQSDKPLKMSYRSSFVESVLQSHICEGHLDRSFFHGRTINAVYMIGFDQLCARSKPIGGLSGLVSNVSG
jgi:hypothetical protein